MAHHVRGSGASLDVGEELLAILGAPAAAAFEAVVKIRTKREPAPATQTVDGGTVSVRFKAPQRAITRGQAAVFYQWNDSLRLREVIGGGKISGTLS
jgi:tRNA U34 2-thiouridine synthase MnmA/TrmU